MLTVKLKKLWKDLNVKFKLLIIFLMLNIVGYGQVCWKKFDPSICKYSIVSEVGVSKRIPPTNHFKFFDPAFELELNLGMSKIITDRYGVGLYGFANAFAGDGGAFQTGMRLKFSNYIKDKFEIALEPGIIFYHTRDEYEIPLGYSFETSFNWKNRIGAFTRIDLLKKNTGNDMVSLGNFASKRAENFLQI